jgi:hypothetical protein
MVGPRHYCSVALLGAPAIRSTSHNEDRFGGLRSGDRAWTDIHVLADVTCASLTMPLTKKGSKIMGAMKEQYGAKKGEQVFYASKNKGNITGVDKPRKKKKGLMN